MATNDCHYLEPDDHTAHDVLLCIQTGKTLNDDKRWRFGTDQLYVKGPDEMQRAFPGLDEAIDNTLDIARRCTLELRFGRYQFPVYQVPAGITLEEQLERDARAGLAERLALLRQQPAWTAERERVYQRAHRTASSTSSPSMGFAGYFLIVADFTNYAKRQGIPVGPGRGSAAGSLVAYALRITDLDPIPYNLLFERFLNPERKSMPDIDMDFCFERRDEVIRYVREKLRRGPRGADHHVRDAEGEGGDQGRRPRPRVQLRRDRQASPSSIRRPSRARTSRSPRRWRWSRACASCASRASASSSSSSTRSSSRACCATPPSTPPASSSAARPLVEDLPLFVDKEGSVMTQFAGPHIDEIGLIKFDFLGLKTLTLLHNVVRRIADGPRGRRSTSSTLPLDDKKTYRLIAKGDTVGVFQMESGGMRKLVTQLRPDTFEDVIAVLALFRPGPLDSGMVEEFIKRKHGKEEVKYPHPKLEPILEPTYGVIVYQEQVMQIAQVLAGYSARRRRQPAPRHGQEGSREDGRRSASASSPARGQQGIPEAQGGRDLRPDGDLRHVRLQQVALGGLRAGLLPDRLPEGALPRGVHGRAADDGDERHRQDVQEHRRVPRARHPGSCRPTSTRAARTSPCSPTPTPTASAPSASASAPSAASAAKPSRPSSPPATNGGPFTSLGDFCKRVLAKPRERFPPP